MVEADAPRRWLIQMPPPHRFLKHVACIWLHLVPSRLARASCCRQSTRKNTIRRCSFHPVPRSLFFFLFFWPSFHDVDENESKHSHSRLPARWYLILRESVAVYTHLLSACLLSACLFSRGLSVVLPRFFPPPIPDSWHASLTTTCNRRPRAAFSSPPLTCPHPRHDVTVLGFTDPAAAARTSASSRQAQLRQRHLQGARGVFVVGNRRRRGRGSGRGSGQGGGTGAREAERRGGRGSGATGPTPHHRGVSRRWVGLCPPCVRGVACVLSSFFPACRCTFGRPNSKRTNCNLSVFEMSLFGQRACDPSCRRAPYPIKFCRFVRGDVAFFFALALLLVPSYYYGSTGRL